MRFSYVRERRKERESERRKLSNPEGEAKEKSVKSDKAETEKVSQKKKAKDVSAKKEFTINSSKKKEPKKRDQTLSSIEKRMPKTVKRGDEMKRVPSATKKTRSEHVCEECEKMGFGIENPAVAEVKLNGRDRWLCESCLRACGIVS